MNVLYLLLRENARGELDEAGLQPLAAKETPDWVPAAAIAVIGRTDAP